VYGIQGGVRKVLKNRLESGEEKYNPRESAGFRKRRSTLDNAFVLNHVMQREKGKMEKMERYIYFSRI